ncbi:hypothetical protein [Tabrizicola caldifontis]|uniref:hypothetical protein n=1 Tax=Tabrizicola caldifontis TaxID=2528036 RepID=UPI001081FD0B|nr:hypothetical protein [Rhodobacter sp. YIM 73028]
MEGLFALLFGLAALWFALWLFILLPARMAEARGRSAVVWVLLSLIFSPFFAIFFLWLLGDAGNRRA